MTNRLPTALSDSDLLTETARAATVERRATADLLALLAEVDRRRLYLGLGYSSLFTYCTQALHLSEPAAYSRITAARAAARWPLILTRLAAGDVTLTTLTILAAQLTDENHEALLDAARRKSKRDVERLVAALDPQPDVPSILRRLPAPTVAAVPQAAVAPSLPLSEVEVPAAPETSSSSAASTESGPVPAPTPRPPRAVVEPLAADRYLLRVTLSEAAHADFEHIRELLRHTLPTGDPAAIVARALAVLRHQLERTRHGTTLRPQAAARPAARPSSQESRHVPAAVKRAVWNRDGGRCAFVGTDGRCTATGLLEFHHVTPFARGGPTTAENLELRCRAHNAHEAERDFGRPSNRPADRPS
jgi:5-methylcytosine-specific restriction endonuclease McrA